MNLMMSRNVPVGQKTDNSQVPDGDHGRSDEDFQAALDAIRELHHARLVMCKPGQVQFLCFETKDCACWKTE